MRWISLSDFHYHSVLQFEHLPRKIVLKCHNRGQSLQWIMTRIIISSSFCLVLVHCNSPFSFVFCVSIIVDSLFKYPFFVGPCWPSLVSLYPISSPLQPSRRQSKSCNAERKTGFFKYWCQRFWDVLYRPWTVVLGWLLKEECVAISECTHTDRKWNMHRQADFSNSKHTGIHTVLWLIERSSPKPCCLFCFIPHHPNLCEGFDSLLWEIKCTHSCLV